MTKTNKLNYLTIKVFFILFFFLNISYGQKITPISINNEMFVLPGKWELEGKIKSSAQWVFSNKKLKLTLLINVREMDIFEFYESELSELEFLKRFFAWELEYFLQDLNKYEIEKIEESEINEFIVWRLKVKESNLESFIISGMKNRRLIGIGVKDNDQNKTRSRQEKIDLIKKIYFQK